MKKIASFLLALIMLLSLCTTMAFAATFTITNGTPYESKDTNHGYIGVDTSSGEGETVYISVCPAKNYKLKDGSLKVTYVDGETKTIDPDLDEAYPNFISEYTFQMPTADVTVTAEFEAKPVPTLTTADCIKTYDGIAVCPTYSTNSIGTVTISFANTSDPDDDWSEPEELNNIEFKDRVDKYFKFFVEETEEYAENEAIGHIWIQPCEVTVTAPNLTFSLDATDEYIDAEIKSQINIEAYDSENKRGVLDGDEITYKWVREEGSFGGSRELDKSYNIYFVDEYGDETGGGYQGNYTVCYVGGTLKFEESEEPVVPPKPVKPAPCPIVKAAVKTAVKTVVAVKTVIAVKTVAVVKTVSAVVSNILKWF